MKGRGYTERRLAKFFDEYRDESTGAVITKAVGKSFLMAWPQHLSDAAAAANDDDDDDDDGEVLDVYVVKRAAVTAAFELACALMRIDKILQGRIGSDDENEEEDEGDGEEGESDRKQKKEKSVRMQAAPIVRHRREFGLKKETVY